MANKSLNNKDRNSPNQNNQSSPYQKSQSSPFGKDIQRGLSQNDNELSPNDNAKNPNDEYIPYAGANDPSKNP